MGADQPWDDPWLIGKSPQQYDAADKARDLWYQSQNLNKEQREAVYYRWHNEGLLPNPNHFNPNSYTWKQLKKMERWLIRYKNIPPFNLHLAEELADHWEKLTNEQNDELIRELDAAGIYPSADGNYWLQFMPLQDLKSIEYMLRRYPLEEPFTSGSSVNGLVSLLVLGGVYLALKRR